MVSKGEKGEKASLIDVISSLVDATPCLRDAPSMHQLVSSTQQLDASSSIWP